MSIRSPSNADEEPPRTEPASLFAEADRLAASGNETSAIALYLRVADAAPDDSAALVKAALLLVRRKQPEHALPHLQEALRRRPGNLTALFLMGEAATASGDDSRAIAAFSEVVRLRPRHAVAWRNLGLLHHRRGALGAAATAYAAAIAAEPTHDENHALLGAVLHQAKRMEEAVRAFRRRVVLVPDHYSALYNLAVTLPLLGDRHGSLRTLGWTSKLRSLQADLWFRIGRAARRVGYGERAAAALRSAVLLCTSEVDALTHLAADREADGDVESATRARRWALVLEPGYQKLRINLIHGLLDAGDLAMASHHAALLDPDAPPEADLFRLLDRLDRTGTARPTALVGWRPAYHRWLAETEVTAPLISVVMPVYDPDPDFLAQAIASVERQSYPAWRLCIADDASTDERVREVLRAAMARDDRIRVVFREINGHISRASNSALALADGSHVGFLDHDDLLAPDALLQIAAVLVARPDLDLVYSDEDKIDEGGARFDPHFKPDWDPDLLTSQNFVCHFAVYRRSLVEAVGGLRPGVEGSQDHDLALRVSERTTADRIHHVARVLYHWRAAAGSTALDVETKPYAREATRRAVQDHFDRTGVPATVETTHAGWRTRRRLPADTPPLTVVIPTKDRAELLRPCIEGLRRGTAWSHGLSVVIVDNGSTEPGALALLDRLAAEEGITVVRSPGPFNYSALNNSGVKTAGGPGLLCFLNNDVEPLDEDWLEEMASHALRPEVGLVGAKLHYPDGTVQHAGVILAGGHVARHVHVGIPGDNGGYWGRANQVQQKSAVTGACMVMRRELFDAVGGFEEALAVDFSDIDLCLRVRRAGYRVIWTPYARLTHHESASRGTFMTPERRVRYDADRRWMVDRWGAMLDRDPFHNPNLAIEPGHDPHDLAFPPRTGPG